MALTELQKAQNKAAQLVRNRAHAARLQQYRREMDAVDAEPEVVQARKKFDDVDAACNEDRARRDVQIKAIQQQIAELEDKLSALRTVDEGLRQSRRFAADAWRQTLDAKKEEVEARFPDLQNAALHSAAGWIPPQDVLDAMEEARRNVAEGETQPKKAPGRKAAIDKGLR